MDTTTADSVKYYSGEGLVRLRGYVTSDSLYVGVEGKIGTGNGNDAFRDIMLFMNVSGVSGVPAGDSLPGGKNDLTPLSFLEGMKMDMETDFAFRITDGDDQSFVGFGDFTADSYSPAFEKTFSEDGPPSVGDATEGRFAYLDAEDLSTADANESGWEFVVPLDAISATASSEFQFFVWYGNERDEGEGVTEPEGEIYSRIIPDDGQASFYGWSEDWGQVSSTQATGAQLLPVELASFEARRDGKDAILSWQTASETNNAGFAVQHAVGSGDFDRIGWVDGTGTTTEAQTYRFTAENLSAGTHRFRLKQRDLDGSTSLSDAVEVEVQPEGPIAIQQVAPNPVSGTGTLRFTARESGPVTIGLYDVLGRQVKTLHNGPVSSGQSQQVTLDASALSSGVYFLRIKGDDFTRTERITVTQ